MGILNRYILRQIWTPAFFASIVVIFLMIAGAVQQQLKTLLQELPIAQVTLGDISWISLLAAPTLIGYIVPITFLLGIMLTFGRLSQSNELTAMKAAGIPMHNLIVPVIVAGAGLSVLVFGVQNLAQPWAFTRLMQFVSRDLPLRVTIDALPTGVMHDYGDWRVYLGSRDADGTLHDIVVLQPQEDGQATAFYADEARLTSTAGAMTLTMRNGHYIMPERNGLVPRSVFPELQINVPSLGAFDPPDDVHGMTLSSLFREQKRLEAEVERTKAEPVIYSLYGMRYELGERFAFPLMCLSLALAATPLAGRAQRGGRSYLFAGALLILGLYFILRTVVQPPSLLPLSLTLLMAQIPNITLCIIGLALIWKVDRV